MKRHLFILLAFLLAAYSQGQVKLLLIDSLSNRAIQFASVWVVDKENGATSNDKGEVVLGELDPEDVILCSAVGYFIKHIPASAVDSIILLNPRKSFLDEVTVVSTTIKEPIRLGTYKKSETRRYGYGCGEIPWIVARYYDGSNYANQNPYLTEIKVATSSDITGATMGIRIYRKDSMGFPGEMINTKPILIKVKKGFSNNRIDVSPYHIQVPSDGFFVGFEWLIIESNKHMVDVFDSTTGKTTKNGHTTYQPSIGMLPVSDTTRTFTFDRGAWKRTHRQVHIDHKWTIGVPAVEVALKK